MEQEGGLFLGLCAELLIGDCWLFVCWRASWCSIMCKTDLHRIGGTLRRRGHTVSLPCESKVACVCPSNAQSPWAHMQSFHLFACVSAVVGWQWRHKRIFSGREKTYGVPVLGTCRHVTCRNCLILILYYFIFVITSPAHFYGIPGNDVINWTLFPLHAMLLMVLVFTAGI